MIPWRAKGSLQIKWQERTCKKKLPTPYWSHISDITTQQQNTIFDPSLCLLVKMLYHSVTLIVIDYHKIHFKTCSIFLVLAVTVWFLYTNISEWLHEEKRQGVIKRPWKFFKKHCLHLCVSKMAQTWEKITSRGNYYHYY